MSEKRKPEGDSGELQRKKQKRGFQVGPANLPDGTYKRKTQKIKENLIKRAKLKKDYARLRQKVATEDERIPIPASLQQQEFQQAEADDDHDDVDETATADPTTIPHPDRQTLIDNANDHAEPDLHTNNVEPQDSRARRKRKPKPQPFQREHEAALQRKAAAEERRQAREEAQRQRQVKLEERERFRKAMAKARSGGPNGQRKLGRESKVLLEKVKRMVGDGR